MIRKRTTLTTTERRQRLFCLLFGCILLGTAWGMVMLRWQYDGVPTGWARLSGNVFSDQAYSSGTLDGERRGHPAVPAGVFSAGAFRLWDSLLRGCCC